MTIEASAARGGHITDEDDERRGAVNESLKGCQTPRLASGPMNAKQIAALAGFVLAISAAYAAWGRLRRAFE
jgi:hypothetical protein